MNDLDKWLSAISERCSVNILKVEDIWGRFSIEFEFIYAPCRIGGRANVFVPSEYDERKVNNLCGNINDMHSEVL